jgi:hypothetical protein
LKPARLHSEILLKKMAKWKHRDHTYLYDICIIMCVCIYIYIYIYLYKYRDREKKVVLVSPFQGTTGSESDEENVRE